MIRCARLTERDIFIASKTQTLPSRTAVWSMAKVRGKSKIVWEPTLKAKPADGIKSSDYCDAKPFIPSYDKVS